MLQDHETLDRARLVATVLTIRGYRVRTPYDASLDDEELQRWETCIEIVRTLSGDGAAIASEP